MFWNIEFFCAAKLQKNNQIQKIIQNFIAQLSGKLRIFAA